MWKYNVFKKTNQTQNVCYELMYGVFGTVWCGSNENLKAQQFKIELQIRLVDYTQC